jgi:hypothetical protein
LDDGSPVKVAMLDRSLHRAAVGDRVTLAFGVDRLNIFPQVAT